MSDYIPTYIMYFFNHYNNISFWLKTVLAFKNIFKVAHDLENCQVYPLDDRVLKNAMTVAPFSSYSL